MEVKSILMAAVNKNYKLFSVLFYISGILPVISFFIVLRMLVFGDNDNVFSIMLNIAVIFIAALITVFTVKIKAFIPYVFIIVPLFISCLIFIEKDAGLFRIIYETVVTIPVYYSSVRLVHIPLQRTYSDTKVFYLCIILFLVQFIAIYFTKELAYLNTFIIIFMYISLVIGFFLKNQNKIDNIYINDDIHKSVIPRGLRSFNTVLTASVSFAMVLVFVFRDFAVSVLRFVKNVIIWLIVTIFKIINFLFKDFSGKDDNIKHGKPKLPEFGEASESGGSGWLFMLLAALLLIYLIYRLAKLVIKLMPSLIKRLKDFVYKLLRINTRIRINNESEFFDEIISLEADTSNEKKSVKQAGKHFKTLMKVSSIKKIKNPVEKVRLIYSQIILLLKSKELTIDKSKTTGEIYGLAVPMHLEDKSFKQITGLYNKVRYADLVPDENEISEIEKNYEICRNSEKK